MESRCPVCGCPLLKLEDRCPNCGNTNTAKPPPKANTMGWLALVAVGLLVALLAGGFWVMQTVVSEPPQPSSSLPAVAYSSQKEESSQPPASSLDSVSKQESKPQESKKKPLVNTYYYLEEGSWDVNDHRPRVIFYTDGTFSLWENLFDGMGHFSGTYRQKGNTLTLTVQGVDFSGFTCADVKTIEFTLVTPTQLQLHTNLAMSRDTPLFTTLKK